MKMTVSVNNQSGVPYVQYGTDKQKAKAAKFVQSTDKDLTNLAYKINDRKHRDSKFVKNVAKAILAVPVVAAGVTAAATKGKVSARTIAGAKSFLKTAGGMAIVGGVIRTNEIMKKDPKLNKAEKKHPILTLAGLTAVATSALLGGKSIAKTLSPKVSEKLVKLGKKINLDKAAAKMDKAPEAIRTMASNVASKISLPKGVKEKLSTISSKIKMPQILKDGYSKIANLEATKTATNAMKKAGKAMAKNPATTAFAFVGAAIVANAVKKAVETSATKAKLKEAQMKTANSLIYAYAAENDSLKSANAKAAAKLEEANNVIASENAETENANKTEDAE